MQWLADLSRCAGLPGADDLFVARGTLPADAWRIVSEACGIAEDDLARRVAEALRHREVSPILIVLTNFPYPAYRKRCQELGAQDFLDKSTEFPAAVEVLQALVPNGTRQSAKARHRQ